MFKRQICEFCQAEFVPSRAPSKNRRQRFCSMKCRGRVYRGNNSPTYKGGYLTRNGYRMISIENKRILEHRHVMQQILRRVLEPGEVIHHIDRDKLNNDPLNLRLHPTQSTHAQEHATVFRSSTHKQCTVCRIIKPRTMFDAGRKDGINTDPNFTQCKSCRKAYCAERWKQGKTTYQRLMKST